MPSLLQLQSIGKRFAGVAALDDVSFVVNAGEIHALMGENGAGKSTLIKILTGQYTQFDGRITIEGRSFAPRGPRDAQDRFGVACIHQELSLVPELSVENNIFLAREPRTRWRTLDQPKMRRNVRAVLDRLGVDLDPRLPVSALRTGEQQIVEIACALTLNARLLLLDEPTSALSDREIERLMVLLGDLRRDGVTIIYISHKLEEVFRLADRLSVLRDGRLVGTRNREDVDAATVIEMMSGRPIDQLFPKPEHALGSMALDIEGLNLAPSNVMGDRPLRDISFTLSRGEILGVAGLMGAGKTELLETIFGANGSRRVSTQRFELNGTERSPFRRPSDALQAGIALVTEDRKLKSLVLPLSVRANMTMSALRSFLAAGWIRERLERQTVTREIAALGIKTPGPDATVASLSGGNQQKVVLARCLLIKPRILLLDEPTRGIDVGAKAEIYRLIGALTQGGMSVILASSELPELLALCDRIMVLSDGRLAATFDRASATPERILEAAMTNTRGEASRAPELLAA